LVLDSRRRIAVHRATTSAAWFPAEARSEAAEERIVVFCHSAPGAGIFDPDPVETRSRNVRLLSVDRPGYGGSQPLRAGEWATVASAADDLATVLDSLCVDRVGVVGWSAGGRVALALAARRPDLVDRVAVLATPAPDAEVPWIDDDERDELERLRDRARRERERAEDAERAAAAQVATLALGLPGASMPGGPASAAGGVAQAVALSPFRRPFGGPQTREQRMWERAMARAEATEMLRNRLIDGGHVPPPGKLTPEEAQRFVEAHERNHGPLSAHESLALQGRLVQGEPPPSLAKSAHLYEEPQWSRDLSEFLDVAAAAQMAAGPPGGVTGTVTRLPNILRRVPVGGLRATVAIDRPFDDAERLASELWRRDLPTKQSSTSSQPWAKYEIEQTGPVNIQMKGGDADPVWADGYRTSEGFIQDAKHVKDPDYSPYVHDSTYNPAKRAKIDARLDGEMERYAAVIRDPGNPARAVEIITNHERAVKFFEDLLAKHDVPGRVVVRP
jgi:pimeloyl-ACP methyl ester carboxylesterase